MRTKSILYLFIFILGIACNSIQQEDSKFQPALDSLKYDNEKYEAAEFLLEHVNTQFHSDLSNADGVRPILELFDSLDKEGIETRKPGTVSPIPILKERWESLKENQYYVEQKTNNDKDLLTPDDLIKNVELASDIWKKTSWHSEYSRDVFNEYVLPYKINNEPLSSQWRTHFIKEYKDVFDSLNLLNNPEEFCRYINADLGSWFRYNTLMLEYNCSMSFEELMLGKRGRCPHMVCLAAYALRANGIPVAVDYCPIYGNYSTGHQWLSFIKPNGDFIPFNASDDGWVPMGYVVDNQTKWYKMAKVFRETFSLQDENIELLKSGAEIPPVFLNVHYKDVTSEYMPTSEYTLSVNADEPYEFAYMCIYNNTSWVPIAWAKVSDGKATFKDLGRDIAYLPAFYHNSTIIPASNPILIYKNGTVADIKPHKGRAQTVILDRKFPNFITQRDDTTNVILPGDEYELYYWNNNDWESLGIKTTDDNENAFSSIGFHFRIEELKEENADKLNRPHLIYRNTPYGGLYVLRNHTRGKEERIFTIENGNQVWW